MKKLLILFTSLLILFFISARAPHSDSTVELFCTELNDDLTQIHANAIQSAKKSVLLFIFSLHDPTIIQALKSKSEEGVSVNIITDAKASANITSLLGSHIKITPRYFKGLMHLKILVIDEMQVLLGSANMTTASLKKHHNLVLSVEHPALAQAIHQRAQDKTIPNSNFTTPDQTLEMWFLPDNKDAPQKIIQLIQSAKKTIRVAMYTWTRFDFALELIKAQKRGVDVQVAIDKQSTHHISKKITKYLKENNIPTIINSDPSLLHHKFLYIDERILVLGSANWTKAAFDTNDDCFIILEPLTPQQITKMNKLIEIIK